MSNAYIPDEADTQDDQDSVSVSQSPVLIGSDASDVSDDFIDVETVTQPVDEPQVVASNTNSPVLIGEDDDSSPEEGELTDYGDEINVDDDSRDAPEVRSRRTESDMSVIIIGETPAPTNALVSNVEIVGLAGNENPPTENRTERFPESNAASGSGAVSSQDRTGNEGLPIDSSVRPGPSGLQQGFSVNRWLASGVQMSSSVLSEHIEPLSVPQLPSPSTSTLNTSAGEFRSPKRRKIESPQKKGDTSVEIDEEAECCPICFEPWTNSGKHRLASLKCGHLFGQSCIEKWLRGQGGKCPQCNAKATRKDMRIIYAKALRALDTSERDRALRDLDTERQARQNVEFELAQFRMKYQQSRQQVQDLQKTIDEQKDALNQFRVNPSSTGAHPTQSSEPSTSAHSTQSNEGYAFDRVIKVWDLGSCRVMAHSSVVGYLVASQPSAIPLFPGFGVKKLSCVDFKTSQYVSIHSKPIRDLAFNVKSADGLLLSCSMDKFVKLTNLHSNTVVLSYQCDMPVWSCTWNPDDKQYFYAGQQNGVVRVFDTRNTTECVQQLNTGLTGSRSPVVALEYVGKNPHANFRPGGLLVGQLDRIMFYEKKADEFKPHMLPSEGSLASLSLEETTRHILATYRPSGKYSNIRHQLSELTSSAMDGDAQNQVCTSNAVQTFQAGRAMKQLTRSRLLHHPTQAGCLFVCAPDETSCTLQIFDCSSGLLKKNIPTHQPVIDVCPMNVYGEHYLAALTDKVIRLHKWR